MTPRVQHECPYCGSTEIIEDSTEYCTPTRYFLQCQDCMMETGTVIDDEELDDLWKNDEEIE